MTKSRRLGIAFALLLTFALVFANIIPFTSLGNGNVAGALTVSAHTEYLNEYTGTYYNNLNVSLTGTAFRSELAKLITSTHHTNTTYNKGELALQNVWPQSDKDISNLNGNTMKWFYTGTVVSANSFGGSVGQTNREHVWAKNGGDTFTAESGPGADAHHLRPTECQLNSTRGNLGFGEVAQTTNNIAKQNNSTSYGTFPDGLCFRSGSFFYPAKGYRGATARILMYMQVRYGDQFNLYFVDGATTSNGKGIGKISDLFKWHLQEPPTEEEIYRNNAVAAIQGNRNPFIDHPEYAEMIYCNDGQSYSNTLANLVAQYGSYLDNNNPPTPPTLTGLTLSQTSLNLTEGQVSQQITVTAIPSSVSNSVTWSTSNSSVATVSNGVITAVGVGTATITATSTVNTSIKASLTVNVSAKKVEVQSISISPNSLTLTQGGTAQLTVTASPSGASNSVTWSTSNSSVATVVNGVVTAVGAGTATITATSTENTSIKSSMTITVVSNKVQVQAISISPSSLTLTQGDTGQLTVTASPSGASNSVTWSTSNSSVATVTNGVVTAVGVGTATITATSTENTSIKSSMTITVVSDKVELQSLSISPTDITLYLGGQGCALLYVTASPAGASNAVTWSSSDESVAVVLNPDSKEGYLVAIGEGTAIITATSVGNPSISVSITITVVREPSSPEAIAEFNKCMDEYNSATTLEERHNALKKAMQAFNNLSVGDREQSSDYYQTLKTAVVKYNNDATRENDKFESAVSFVSQVSAASFSIAFLALIIAQFVGVVVIFRR